MKVKSPVAISQADAMVILKAQDDLSAVLDALEAAEGRLETAEDGAVAIGAYPATGPDIAGFLAACAQGKTFIASPSDVVKDRSQ